MTDLFSHQSALARTGEHAHAPNDAPEQTLAEARAEWEHTITQKGGVCPCCDRFGNIYARAINKTMARALIWLNHQSGSVVWIDVPTAAPKWLLRSNQLPTLRWWGLVERQPSTDSNAKHSGMWRSTTKGAAFAANLLAIPKQVFTYNGEVRGFSEETVLISQCIENFSYAAVMQEQSAP